MPAPGHAPGCTGMKDAGMPASFFFIAGPPQDENGPLGGQRTLHSKGRVGGIFQAGGDSTVSRVTSACSCSHRQKAATSGRAALRGPTISQ